MKTRLWLVIFLILFSVIVTADHRVFEIKNNLVQKDFSVQKQKRIILESISKNDITQVIENGCKIKHRLKRQTSFSCPQDFKLSEKTREARLFYIVDLESAEQIQADMVWAESITGSGSVVVILDTGVDYTHPELSDNYLGGFDFVENDDDPQDNHGHGTHVSGIITGKGDTVASGTYAKGIAPDSGFYMLKVCDASGSCSEDDMEAAMEYAVSDLSARIMSISIGGGNYGSHCDSDSLAAKVNWVVDNGYSVVIASGNDGSGVSSPACAQKAIAVGAVNSDNNLASWSNTGSALDIVAPGVNILSTYSCLAAGDCSTSWYTDMSGTSMATPHVSGVIALMLNENPGLSDAEIKDALYSTADSASGCYECRFVWRGRCYGQQAIPCTSEQVGAGVVNAYEAYLAIKNNECIPSDELCDGLDNDCDNDIDEGFDVGDVCFNGIGECEDSGIKVCSADKLSTECNAVPKQPANDDSLCDGLDNDCNGQIDEDFVIITTNCGLGECASSGSLTCVNGTEVDSCSPGIPAFNDATCNKLDEDCDGLYNEDYLPVTCGIGLCEAQSTCIAGVESCTPGSPSAELCNGLDDDCNSIIDDNLIEPLCNNQNGVCSGSTKECGGVSGWFICDATNYGTDYETIETTCDDSEDNDCDNLVDLDDSDCQNCIDNDNDGYYAISGECATGNDCNDNNVNVNPGKSDASCDGVDNDCNNLIDENYVNTATDCGIGQCYSTGELSCVNGTEVDSCNPGTPDVDDSSCNNIDNDCDDNVDEDFITTPTDCGIGQCYSTGQMVCQSGSEVDTCNPGNPVSEVCDGLDNDCDDSIDEGGVCEITSCWDASNTYLRRSSAQASKFCKCAQGTYSYSRVSYRWGSYTAYEYIDSANNENWATQGVSNFFPIYRVQCADGNWYYANQDY